MWKRSTAFPSIVWVYAGVKRIEVLRLSVNFGSSRAPTTSLVLTIVIVAKNIHINSDNNGDNHNKNNDHIRITIKY